LIDPLQENISQSRQAKLLGICRSSLYYDPVVSQADIACMKAIDKIFTARPFYGSRRIQVDLKHNYKIDACRDHVRSLMRIMGLEAVYPKKANNTSVKDPNHAIYPYLIRNVSASFSNHIWGSDITYIRMAHGFCYLYSIIDWWSRKVVGWDLSPTMESDFCIETMDRAIQKFGAPEISNTDQGSQFTDKKFIEILKKNDVNISMDGRGRCLDNIFTERLWRSLKYEEVYLKSYQDIAEARTNIAAYFFFYNNKRRHQSLEYKTPAEIYANKNRLAPDAKLQNNLSILTSSILSTNTV
jgi:putative transposase